MKKIKIFHLPVFIAALLGGIIAVVLYMYVSGNSLADYARNLQDGQFICENGYIYEKIKETDSGLITANRVGHSGCRFTILFGRKPADKLLPHEYAMQITDYGSIFMDKQGTVWLLQNLNHNSTQARLSQFFLPSAELDTADVGQLPIDSATQKLSGGGSSYYPHSVPINYHSITIPFKAELTSELNTYRKYFRNTKVEFSVKLKDGWHCVDVYRPNTQYSIDPNKYNQSIKLLNLCRGVYMNAQCRLTVYDKNNDRALSQCEFGLIISEGKAYIEVSG